MSTHRRLLYASQNGDRWFLLRHENGDVAVRHEPNLSSGGRASEMTVAAFLEAGRGGPEHAELLRLIGTLVGEGDATPSLA